MNLKVSSDSELYCFSKMVHDRLFSLIYEILGIDNQEQAKAAGFRVETSQI